MTGSQISRELALALISDNVVSKIQRIPFPLNETNRIFLPTSVGQAGLGQDSKGPDAFGFHLFSYSENLLSGNICIARDNGEDDRPLAPDMTIHKPSHQRNIILSCHAFCWCPEDAWEINDAQVLFVWSAELYAKQIVAGGGLAAFEGLAWAWYTHSLLYRPMVMVVN
jgi:hypothetical protein